MSLPLLRASCRDLAHPVLKHTNTVLKDIQEQHYESCAVRLDFLGTLGLLKCKEEHRPEGGLLAQTYQYAPPITTHCSVDGLSD